MLTTITMILFISLFLTGCTTKNNQAIDASLLTASWDEVTAIAKGQEVNIYMWGGSDTINKYIDDWVAPRLKKQTGVVLKRIPVNDTKDIIQKLLTEKQLGKKEGSIDIIWINGENFKDAKEQNLLWGSINEQLPNFNRFVEKDADNIRFDFGEDIAGLEAPWGTAQFVFVYDENKVKNPPKSMEELKQWVINNPGKFTYPAPPDFTGSAFVRHVLYETTGGHQQYLKRLSEQENLEQTLEPMWSYLNEIEPYLWREGATYPESSAKLDLLYANGEVWMTMGYDPGRASAQIQKGIFPQSSKTFVLNNGTLSNTHYLSIPFNAPNKAGALVAINYLLSPEAQIAKLDPMNWGDLLAIDPNKLSKEDRVVIEKMDTGIATLTMDQLVKHRVPEIPAEYISVIEKGWLENVAKE
ncbi:ABC transporter substrate-binding protein [Lottiidibacillus patelloidae]|uniref:ABC transporter substrate-binding protein n=2 Tax=Lottiidibacillus patelloidae TaxID=2670334 RepID=A0A263BUT9_9BACI|nr:ABC transporter substrate-binding protein [Lottiidibacillus patelloidae]